GAETALAAVEHLGPERLELRGPVLLPLVGEGGRRPVRRPRLRGGGRDGRRGRRLRAAFLRDRQEIGAEELFHLRVTLEGSLHADAPLTNATVSPTIVFSASSIVPRN